MPATLIVPPMAEVALYGVTAIKITARKISLLDAAFKEMASTRHSRKDDIPGNKSVGELISFVLRK